MQKDYDSWNIQKKQIDQSRMSKIFKPGEIWWCSVGLNVDIEINGKGDYFRRPVLIYKKLSRKSFIGIPVTSKFKDGSWFSPVIVRTNINFVVLNQIRLFSSKRLQKKLCSISDKDYINIKQKLEVFLEV